MWPTGVFLTVALVSGVCSPVCRVAAASLPLDGGHDRALLAVSIVVVLLASRPADHVRHRGECAARPGSASPVLPSRSLLGGCGGITKSTGPVIVDHSRAPRSATTWAMCSSLSSSGPGSSSTFASGRSERRIASVADDATTGRRGETESWSPTLAAIRSPAMERSCSPMSTPSVKPIRRELDRPGATIRRMGSVMELSSSIWRRSSTSPGGPLPVLRAVLHDRRVSRRPGWPAILEHLDETWGADRRAARSCATTSIDWVGPAHCAHSLEDDHDPARSELPRRQRGRAVP